MSKRENIRFGPIWNAPTAGPWWMSQTDGNHDKSSKMPVMTLVDHRFYHGVFRVQRAICEYQRHAYWPFLLFVPFLYLNNLPFLAVPCITGSVHATIYTSSAAKEKNTCALAEVEAGQTPASPLISRGFSHTKGLVHSMLVPDPLAASLKKISGGTMGFVNRDRLCLFSSLKRNQWVTSGTNGGGGGGVRGGNMASYTQHSRRIGNFSRTSFLLPPCMAFDLMPSKTTFVPTGRRECPEWPRRGTVPTFSPHTPHALQLV